MEKEIEKKDQTLFKVLKIRNKPKTKERLNFTISKDTAEKFKLVCKEQGYNMSAKIENAMKEIIEACDKK